MGSSTKRTEQGVGAANAAPASSRARAKRTLPIRSSPVSTAPSLRSKLSTLETPARRAAPALARAKAKIPPFARNSVLQELEPRLLMSADLNPLAHDTLFASPALAGAEFRNIADQGTPTVVASAAVAPIQRTNELVFVDTATPDYQQLIDSMRASALGQGRNLEFVLIDADCDGIRKITDTLAKKSDLDAIHIVSHATDGAAQLGSSKLDFDSLVKRAAAINKWGAALSENGDILFYGCDLAASQAGKSLLDALSRLTGADVAASEDLTGSAARGGDWDLEFRTGSIETEVAAGPAGKSSWNHTLATFTVTTTADTGPGSLRAAITSANAAGADTINFNISTADPNYNAATGTWTITVGTAASGNTALPILTSGGGAVTVDGTTQPGYAGTPLIQIVAGNVSASAAAAQDGLSIAGANSVVRGLTISGFSSDGIQLDGDNVAIAGNYIGTNAAGSAAAANGTGININAGNGDTIGSAVAADRNVISGNTNDGIFIANTDSHTIAGNFIGTNATATAGLGNGRDGIRLAGDNDLVTIGGVTGPDSNVIAFNTGSAVNVLDANADQNTIRRNAIHDNTAGGIVLAGHTQEAFGGFDPDAGANEGQNYPDFTAATVSVVGGNLQLSGLTLSTTANSTYAIDFYANPAAAVNLQGNRYLGTLTVPTDGAGNIGPWVVVFANKSLLAGDRITATATGVAGGTPAAEIGNTSPVSTTFVTVPLAGTLSLSGTVYEDANGDGSIADGVGRSGVLIKLYTDNGDNTPGLHDQLIMTTTTVAGGGYTFNTLTNGTYWVVVDSKTITSSVALLGGHVAGETWAEETYATANNTAIGSAGAIRAVSYNGSYQFATATGAFLGGLVANRSDDATTLSATTAVGAEHIQLVSVSNANVAGVDSAYSFTAIVNDRGDAADDDTGAARMQQGSLRQFIQNSNAISGTQTSNFSIGATGSTETIAPTAALPTITDAVILDAWTQGSAGYTGPPLIELNGAGAGAGAHGFDLLADGSTVRGFVINRFGQSGVRIDSDGNTVAGNWIGLDTTGIVGAGNGIDGVVLANLAANNTIGGTGANDGNVLSDNGDEGVSIDGAIGTLVVGNYIGTDATGTVAIGNGGDGVAIQFGAVNSTVGGTTAAERNVIAGNGSNSANGLANVRIRQTGTTSNVVLGNYIGTNWNATATLGNPGYGVLVSEDAFGNMIGGTAAGAGNVIAGSALDGIAMIDAVTGNRALGNVLYGNTGLGIDLADDGVSANDAGDGDAGANGLQNFPVIATANVNGADITITGSLDSTDTRTFRIEFFASSAADGSGHGEGQRYLGFTTVTIAGGATAFSVTLTPAIAVAGGEYVSATATDLTSNETSEFSLAHTANTAPVNTVPATATVNEDTTFAFTGGNLISVADGQSNVNQVVLTVANGTLNVTPAGAAVAGNGSLSVTITGTQAAINATLASLSYQGTLNYNGADTLTVVSTDAGGMQDTVAVAITVNPVNTAPVAVNDSYTVAEDSTLTVGWWDTDWIRRQQITFNNTNIGGFAAAETLSNFPVLLVLDSSKVDYTLTQDDGGDLRFFDADGTPLAHEVERWDETGNSYVWVKVPQIDIGATDSITMYYGNASVADGEDPSAVWAGTGYRSVYHLDDVGPTVEDATSTNYDGAATNGATGGQTGQIGSAYGFDATNDYINLGNDRSFIDGASGATFSAWVNSNNNDGVNANIILSASINNGGAPSGTSRIAIELDPFGDVKFIVRSDDSAVTTVFTTGTPVTAGTWHYITGVVDVVNDTVSVYVDGVARPITPGPYTLPGAAFSNSPSASASIGSSDEGAGPYFDGRIDEARIATAARTAGWIQAEYRAMLNQAGTEFVAFDAVQVAPALGGVLNNDTDVEGNRLSTTVVTNVSNGTLTLNGDGTLIYTPNPNFFGTDTFTYRANDGALDSNVATVTITVTPVNDAPAGTDTTVATSEDTAYTFTVANFGFTDVDALDTMSAVRIETLPAAGTFTLNGAAVAANDLIAVADINGGLLQLTPVANASGAPYTTFTFSVRDQASAFDPAPNTMTVSVAAVNDAPVNTGPASITVTEDVASPITGISIADVDAGGAGMQITLSVPSGTLSALSGGGVVVGGSGSSTLALSGTIANLNAFIAASNVTFLTALNGTAPVTLTVTTSDLGNSGAGGALTDIDTVTLNITAVNDAPAGTNATVSTAEDTAYTFTLADFGFSDPNDAPANAFLAVRIASLPLAGVLTNNAVAVNPGDFVLAADIALGRLVFTAAANANGAGYASFTFQVQDNDGTALGGVDLDPSPNTMIADVTAVNDAPTASAPAAYAVTEQVSLNLANTGLAVGDIDAGGAAVTVTLDVVSGTLTALSGTTGVGIVGSGSGTLTLTGTVAQLNNLLLGAGGSTLSHVIASDTPPATDILTLSINDGGNTGAGGALNASANSTINITALNDAPVNAVPASITVTEDLASALTGISIADVDAAGGSVLITLSVPSGTLAATTSGGVTVGGSGSGTLTLSGTVGNINAFIAASNVTFTTALNDTSAVTLTVTTDDQGNTPAPALNDSDTVTLNVTAVNDAPVNTVPPAQATGEDAALVFSAGTGNLVSIADLDAGAGLVDVTLTVTNGTLTLAGTSGLAFQAGADGTATMTVRGTIADINTAMNGMSYSPASSYNGPASLTITTDDRGFTGAGGALNDGDVVNIAVNPVNDAPVNTVPVSITVTEDVASALTGISIADVDAGAGSVFVTLSVPAGTLAAVTGGGVVVGGSGSGTVTLTGTVPNINAFIAASNVTFTTALNDTSAVTLTVTTDDQGNTPAPALNDVDTVTLNVTAINDAPVNTVPGPQVVNEDTPLMFAVAGGNAIAVADPDAATLRVTLTATNGVLTLASLAGLAFSTGGGAADANMTFTGTAAAINFALDGLSFLPALNYNGPASVAITTEDLGQTGAGGALQDADVVNVTVNAVNDAPVIGNRAFAVTNGTTVGIGTAELSATDVDDAATSLVFTVGAVTNGHFELASAPGVAITSFTQAQILAGEVRFVHDGSNTAPTATVNVNDAATGVGPYALNITFTATGGAPVTPPGGGGSGGGTPVVVPPPPLPPVTKVETGSPGERIGETYLRAPTSPPADGGDDGGAVEVAAPVVASAPGASQVQKLLAPETALPVGRAEGETVEAKPLSSEVEVEPVRGEMQVLPMRRDAFDNPEDEERQKIEVIMSSVKVTGLAFSVGAVWWAARAAGLIASLLASSPAWRHVDPLPVLGRDDEEKEGEWDEDVSDEEKDRKDDEHRAAWVLEEREAS